MIDGISNGEIIGFILDISSAIQAKLILTELRLWLYL